MTTVTSAISSSHANAPTRVPPASTSSAGSPPPRRASYSSLSFMSPRPLTSPLPASPAPGTSPSFDMKRLLAKPAPPYARNHGYGSGSESEGLSDSPRRGVALVDPGFVPTPTPPRKSKSRETVKDAEEKKEKNKSSLGRSRSMQSISRDPSAPQEKEKEKRPRNVLRRRPSTQNSAPSPTPALPTTSLSPITVSALSLLLPHPRSPLPPISPRSPLTPSMLPTGSPSPSPSHSRKSSPGPRPSSRSTSSVDKPLPVPPRDGREGYGGAQPRRERSKEFRQYDLDKEGEGCIVKVTDEKGEAVDREDEKRRRLRELKGHPFPPSPCRSVSASPSPSPSASRSHSPSMRLHRHPQDINLSASSTTSASPSPVPSRSSRKPLPFSEFTKNSTSTTTKTSVSTSSLTPAAAVVAAYKRQTLLHEKPERRTTGGSSSVDTSASMSGFSRLSFGLGGDGGAGGEGFAAIERIASQAQAHEASERSKEKLKSRRPHTSAGHARAATEPPLRHPTKSKTLDSQTAGTGGEADENGNHQPYYTIFGSSSGRVVAVGGPEDHHHLSWEIAPIAMAGLVRKGSGLRTLTRKVSGRFRRGGAQSEGEDVGEERRGASLSVESTPKRATVAPVVKGEKGGRSLRLSIDKFPEEARVGREGRERETPTSATKSPASAASTPSPSGGGGSRIWKLMKRISTGALRERYTYEDAPPVPSLPKEYAASPVVRPVPVDDEEKDVLGTPLSGGGFGNVIRKKASIVLGVKLSSDGGSPTKPTLPRSPLASHPTPAVRPSPPAPRPSTNTRSSSPMSSDVASSRFFSGPGYKHSSTSAHSSASSLLFEDGVLPPLPQPLLSKTGNLGNHIVPPSELGKITINVRSDEGHGGSQESHSSSSHRTNIQASPTPARSQLVKLTVVVPPTTVPRKSDEYTIVRTPAVEIASLPLPPRRAGRPGRIRRDTNTPTMAEDGWGEQQQQQQGSKVEREAGHEELQEWERMWGCSENRGESQGEGRDLTSSCSGSPTIPSFSIADPINTFASKRSSVDTRRSNPSPSASTVSQPLHRHPPQLDDMGYSPAQTVPPPRPQRSANRPTGASAPTSPIIINEYKLTSLLQHHEPEPPLDRRPQYHVYSDDNKCSSSTIELLPFEYDQRRIPTFPALDTLFNFPSPPSNAGLGLTEQEKAARWDDLLERSAQAGGTLHLGFGGRSGEDGLKSDRLRFSDISELTTDTPYQIKYHEHDPVCLPNYARGGSA
ncbi:hypothetical protein DXG01_011446 [Tephrocybe rancida]|nr:hypothetical protein DXG01_011446 [Tephrocybe rancida]